VLPAGQEIFQDEETMRPEKMQEERESSKGLLPRQKIAPVLQEEIPLLREAEEVCAEKVFQEGREVVQKKEIL